MIEWIQHNARESQAPTTQYDVERSYASLEPGYRQGLTMKDYNISKRYVDLYITRQARNRNRNRNRVPLCAARALNAKGSSPGHAITAVRALKSSPWAMAGGKGAELRPLTRRILAGQGAARPTQLRRARLARPPGG